MDDEQIWTLFFEGRIVPIEMLRGKGLSNDRDYLLRKSTITNNYRLRIEEHKKRSVFPKVKQFKMILSLRAEEDSIYFLIEHITEMMDSWDIYMFNPIGMRSGYKYYRGEKMIIYQISYCMSTKEVKNITKLIKSTTANGHDISNVYKIVIVNRNWNGLKDWKTFDLGRDGEPMFEYFYRSWTNEKLKK